MQVHVASFDMLLAISQVWSRNDCGALVQPCASKDSIRSNQLDICRKSQVQNRFSSAQYVTSLDLSPAGVPADCPIKFHTIPASSGAAPCSGHGAPVAAQGTCQCYVGYDGVACAACADGYQRISGICQRTLTSFKAQAELAALAQSNASKRVSAVSSTSFPAISWHEDTVLQGV